MGSIEKNLFPFFPLAIMGGYGKFAGRVETLLKLAYGFVFFAACSNKVATEQRGNPVSSLQRWHCFNGGSWL